VRAFLEVAGRPLAPLSRQAREYFQEMWSPAAVGRCAVAAYRRVLRAQRGAGR